MTRSPESVTWVRESPARVRFRLRIAFQARMTSVGGFDPASDEDIAPAWFNEEGM